MKTRIAKNPIIRNLLTALVVTGSLFSATAAMASNCPSGFTLTFAQQPNGECQQNPRNQGESHLGRTTTNMTGAWHRQPG